MSQAASHCMHVRADGVGQKAIDFFDLARKSFQRRLSGRPCTSVAVFADLHSALFLSLGPLERP